MSTAPTLPSIDKVYEVYTGKVGCMCGCNGKYSVASKYKKYANNQRGYAINNISDRSVKIIYNKIVKAINNEKVEVTNNYVYIAKGERCLAAYFVE